jgi:GT2 family glycosyltransferase
VAGPVVLAVLVAHASRTRVGEALRSLSEQTYRDIDVVVAAIGDLTIPAPYDPTIVSVREGAGMAEAVMRAFETVDTGDATYVLLLHDDVSLEPDAVERMVTTARTDPAIAAVGAKLLEWFRPDVLQEVGAAIDRFAIRRTALDPGEVDSGQRDDTTDVLFCSDACLLVRRDAFVEVGGLDVKSWPFYEDVDLCWRMRAGGARVVVEPQARVRHAADLSGGRRLFDSLTLREHAEHGRLRFMLKHYAPLGLAVLLPQLMIAAIARLLAALARRELWRVRVIVRSWARTIRELPGILSARRRAPKARIEDRELLSLAARGAVGDVRGERAEWASRMLETLGRTGSAFADLLAPALSRYGLAVDPFEQAEGVHGDHLGAGGLGQVDGPSQRDVAVVRTVDADHDAADGHATSPSVARRIRLAAATASRPGPPAVAASGR